MSVQSASELKPWLVSTDGTHLLVNLSLSPRRLITHELGTACGEAAFYRNLIADGKLRTVKLLIERTVRCDAYSNVQFRRKAGDSSGIQGAGGYVLGF
jgi:hypothetical protein